jgi:hypothetical protein
MAEKLHGQELLDYVQANQGKPEKELATGAGYFTNLPDGGIQVNTKPFYQELAMAQGLIDPSTVGKASIGGRRGKGLSFCLKTNPKSGNAVVTHGYLAPIGVEPGERVVVEIIEEAGEVVLKKAPAEQQVDPEPEATPAPAMAAAGL